MYTRAYSHYHSRAVKPTPMELHNYAGCTLAYTALSKTSRSRINIQHPWLESTYTELTLLCAAYDYRRYNQHMTIIIIYQSPGSHVSQDFLYQKLG